VAVFFAHPYPYRLVERHIFDAIAVLAPLGQVPAGRRRALPARRRCRPASADAAIAVTGNCGRIAASNANMAASGCGPGATARASALACACCSWRKRLASLNCLSRRCNCSISFSRTWLSTCMLIVDFILFSLLFSSAFFYLDRQSPARFRKKAEGNRRK
jgi:hypothetical protein